MQTNAGKYFEYKLYNITTLTDDDFVCYKQKRYTHFWQLKGIFMWIWIKCQSLSEIELMTP